MLLLNLIKKDFLLIKDQLVLILLVSIIIPIYVGNKINNSFLTLLMTTAFSEYFIFSAISVLEEKYDGQKYLCITPYNRRSIVAARYLNINWVFLFNVIIYFILYLTNLTHMENISINSIGAVLLVINTLFAIFIPVEYRFGYSKSKYILMIMFVIIPTWGLVLLNNIVNHFSFGIENILHILSELNGFIFLSSALILIFISYNISINIYNIKDF